MPSLGPQQGEELGGGGGLPPAWPSPVTPTLVECEEDEGRGELPSFSRRKGWRDGCEIMELGAVFSLSSSFISPSAPLSSHHRVYEQYKCMTATSRLDLKQALKEASAVCLLSMAKTEVHLGSSNSLWSAESCHWTDCSHENQINNLIYWTKMFRHEMQPLF